MSTASSMRISFLGMVQLRVPERLQLAHHLQHGLFVDLVIKVRSPRCAVIDRGRIPAVVGMEEVLGFLKSEHYLRSSVFLYAP